MQVHANAVLTDYGILWTCHEDVILTYAVAVMVGTMGELTDSELLVRPRRLT